MMGGPMHSLVMRARRLVAAPDRESLRAAMHLRRRSSTEYGRALDEMQPRHHAAVKAYAAALSAEAAAHRAEARELRELLAEIVRVEIGGQR